MTVLRDLGIGVRFALAGGRTGILRTLMTTIGVGIGVALLLLAVAIPDTLDNQRQRVSQRQTGDQVAAMSDATLIIASAQTTFHDAAIWGVLVHPEGSAPQVPPGLTRLPAAGEAFVSPALRELLAEPGSELLRERLPYRIAGEIGQAGLTGPAELMYYAGDGNLVLSPSTNRIDSFGWAGQSTPFDPVLLLLVTVIFVVMLLPIGVFVAAAVRFGAEQRDRRLAALRLIGADQGTVRRIAAGEALAAALLGLLGGGLFFQVGRMLAQWVPLQGFTVYASDIRPGAGWILLVAVTVPALAVAVTLLGLRGVLIEPLGVVRRAARAPRGLAWRLLLPGVCLTLLLPSIDRVDRSAVQSPFSVLRLAIGLVLLLVSVPALVPWLVETVVRRLSPRGPVPWQLAVRRLQSQPGSPARLVNGVAVAVAGAIALQMLFTGIRTQYEIPAQVDLSRANAQVYVDAGQVPAVRDALTGLPGVRDVQMTQQTHGFIPALKGTAEADTSVLIGDCAALQTLAASISTCHDGDVFQAVTGDRTLAAGTTVTVGEPPVSWRVPATIRPFAAPADGTGAPTPRLLVTPAAFPENVRAGLRSSVLLYADPADPDAIERVRTVFGRLTPTEPVAQLYETETTDRFLNVRRAMLAGTVITLLLIGFSLLVGILEQLRERRRALAVLAAFGTPQRLLGWSVLWQAALPVLLGLLLAVPSGVGVGILLLRMVRSDTAFDLSPVLPVTGIAAAVVLLVTAATLPALRRIMRSDGLRTE